MVGSDVKIGTAGTGTGIVSVTGADTGTGTGLISGT